MNSTGNVTGRRVGSRLPPILVALLLPLAAPAHSEQTNAAAADFLKGPEKAVLAELNLARTRPAEYAKYLEQHRKRFTGTIVVSPEGKRIQTQEGTAAVDEAIAFLKQAKPLPPLSASEPLTLAARDHAGDIGPKGQTEHAGSDKSQPMDRVKRYGAVKSTCGENLSFGHTGARAIVIQLLVDDGVANRGHRKNIFNPDFRMVGIAIGAHKIYEHMCAMDFADEVKAKEK